ncbi:MaoC family dehydratase [Rhodococcus sp. 14C212]|nr:MaoC family dehydratase [Rhodococcus sp. 14C212]
MRVFAGWEEFAAAAGTQLGVSGWRDVTQPMVDTFADVTGDRQWIHVDPVRAAAGPFGATIAHGFLTLSLLPVLMAEVYRVDGLTMALNYGVGKVRFPAPATIPVRVRAVVSFPEYEETSRGFLVTLRSVVEAEGVDRPICVAETLALLAP